MFYVLLLFVCVIGYRMIKEKHMEILHDSEHHELIKLVTFNAFDRK
jgi:hypothetical protein